MDIIYATKNLAKLEAMRRNLEGTGIGIQALTDEEAGLFDAEENGGTPLANARIKALQAYQILHKPVFAVDSGLYFRNVGECFQPGVHVRRVNGKRLDDEEMTAWYAALAVRHGGKLHAYYQNGICLIWDEGKRFELMDETIASREFIISSRPHEKKVEGFPLDRLSLHMETGQYYYDMDKRNYREIMAENGFRDFFMKALESCL